MLNKVEQIIAESLMSRGYSKSEALKFIKVLKGEEDEKILSENIISQIDSILIRHTKKINEYEKLIRENNELRTINVELKESLKELDALTEEAIKNSNLLKRTVKTSFNNLIREIKDAQKTVGDKGVIQN